ncbi:MAG: glycosyltransferase family 2 protein [archaeon]
MKKGISAFILTRNSEKGLRKALESVKWADEIVIVDGFSKDGTLNLCKKYGCKIYQRKFEGFDKEKNFAISKCSYEWIFELDSDEVLDKQIQKNIQETLKNPRYDAYYLKRNDYFLKRPLVTLKLIRLYKKGILHYEGATHEVAGFDKGVKIGMLKGHCYHYANDTDALFQMVNRWDVETEREIVSSARFGKGRISRAKLYYGMFINPMVHFFGLLLYKGFLFKGMHAIIWAACNAFYEFSIYAKYYEVYFLKTRKVDKTTFVS